MSDLTLHQIIADSLHSINHLTEYRALRSDIINQLGKMVLNPERYLDGGRSCYEISLSCHKVGLSDSLLIKTLSQESFLKPAITTGALTLGFDSSHFLVLKFTYKYIDDIIEASNCS